ncbi:AlwI family type II restriction endonuclease [Ruminococcus sp.]|uniref:AlwI family type II restriction endonuclease n=1 Tax=Ruminococcus sp. TaxID=41978 RepID=UPI0025EA6B9B|nr:AlwI family type II restriction endonuclease [Ruminococcus sp.]
MAKSEIIQIDANTYQVTDRVKVLTEYGEKFKELVRTVKNPIDIWLIGNTGMRNPWRIPGGFKVYVESNLVGRLRTPEDQMAFKRLLFEKGEAGGDADKDVSASITRKYRLMFNKYGFAYPEITKKDGFDQAELGPVDAVTPLGQTFYKADSVAAQQECFLRGLIVPMEKLTDDSTFSPLLWVVTVMMEVEKRTGDTKINFIEFATCVQTTNPLTPVEKVVDDILAIREERKQAENKKKYDRELVKKKWEQYLKLEGNFKDYADMNIRYLVSAGIVKRAGRGISLSPEYHSMAIELIKNVVSHEPLKDRLKKLCNGADLPTDNQDIASMVLKDMIAELDYYKIDYTIPDIPLDSAKNINLVRNTLKKNIDQFKEEQYAARQVQEWREIYEYMNLLIVNNGKEKELGEDYSIKVPKSEAAAYLEWILWRAFLAIDHTVNKPYEARGFNIDQDYLPVGTAPGGGPDMIFEFDDCKIVVEVTMSTNSRQEAMEGEPVRRHVADLVMESSKPVYGVFIANKIDSNTAETFRIGVWYNQNDEKLALKIVPFTLEQFSEYFKYMFTNNKNTPIQFLTLFEKCFASKEAKEGPEWKKEIGNIVTQSIR